MSLGAFPLGGAPLGGSGTAAYAEALSESLTGTDTLAAVLTLNPTLLDELELAEELIDDLAPYLTETLTVAGAASPLAALAEALAEGLEVSEAIVIAMTAVAEADGVVDDSLASVHGLLGAIEDALVLAGLAASQHHAQVAVIEAFALETLLRAGWSAAAVSSAEFQAALLSELQIVVALSQAAQAAAIVVPTVTLSVLLADGAEGEDAPTTSLALTEALADGAEVYARISLGADEYAGWVLNTGLRAVTEYRNYPFNSFAQWQGRYYGFGADGLYLLEGDDDAGEPIDAWIRTALETFGTNRYKRIPDLYLGYKADGQLLLKAVSRDDATGDLTEDWYVLQEQSAASHREGRIKLGRGLKSVYWGFELRNVDGADFALDEVAFRPLLLERRV